MEHRKLEIGSVVRNGDDQIDIILNRINNDFIYVVGYKKHHFLHADTVSSMSHVIISDLNVNDYTINPALGRCPIKNINSEPWAFIDENALDQIKKHIIKIQEAVLYSNRYDRCTNLETVDPTPIINLSIGSKIIDEDIILPTMRIPSTLLPFKWLYLLIQDNLEFTDIEIRGKTKTQINNLKVEGFTAMNASNIINALDTKTLNTILMTGQCNIYDHKILRENGIDTNIMVDKFDGILDIISALPINTIYEFIHLMCDACIYNYNIGDTMTLGIMNDNISTLDSMSSDKDVNIKELSRFISRILFGQ